MRIIAGKHRGRVLAQFCGNNVRPTSDRVKESLFHILSFRLPDARVLDLFCGSGALGLEAISRGAREAVFNDISADSLAQIDDLSFISYDENGETAVEGRADRALVDTDTKRMELEGDVVIHAASGDMMITSDALVFDSENDEITADGNVSVSSEDGSFRGTGFRGDLREEAYAFATIDEGVFTL